MKTLKILSALLMLLLLAGCDWSPKNNIDMPFECCQPIDQITSIEIMHKQSATRYDGVPSEALQVVNPSDYAEFLEEISKLQGAEIIPPRSGYGYYYIRITYQDQMFEVVGNCGSGYYYPDGRKLLRDYTFLDNVEYMAFINKWVDAEEPLTEPT